MKYIKWLGMIVILALAACGGSSTPVEETPDITAPTIVSVTKYDAGANTALSSTEPEERLSGAIADATLTVTFSEAIDPDTITTSGDSPSIACNCSPVGSQGSDQGVAQPFTASSEDNIVWTLTPSENLTGYGACGINFGTDIKDAAGNALAEVKYFFRTQCATNDGFTIDTLGFADDNDTEGICWNYQPQSSEGNEISRATYFTVSTEDDVMRYTTADPAGEQNLAPPYSGHMIYKEFEASAFEAAVEFHGFTGKGPGNRCGLVTESQIGEAAAQFIFDSSVLEIGCAVGSSPCSGQPLPEGFTPSSSDPLYLKIQWDGSKYYFYYRTGSESDFTEMTSVTPTAALIGAYNIGIYCSSDSTTFTQEIGSFTIDATATGPGTQY